MILLKNKDKKANIKIGNNIEIKDGNDFPFDLTLYGKSTQATSTSPVSPSPDYPSPIESITEISATVTGKNLFDSSQIVNVSDYIVANGTGIKIIKTTNGRVSPLYNISLKANTEYTISCNLTSTTTYPTMYCQWITNDGSTLWKPNLPNGSTTFTPSKDIVGVIFYLQGTDTDGTYVELTNLQIEKGSTATDYEPYQSNTSSIDLQGNELCSLPNGTKDEVNITSGKSSIVKRTKEFILDENKTIVLEKALTNTTRFLIYNVTSSMNDYPSAISTHFKYLVDYNSDTEHFYITRNGAIYLFVNKSIASTVDELKTWLSKNNVKFLHELAEPETINLGTVEMPHTYEGVSNITNSADTEMVVKYYKKFEFDKILRSGYNIDEQEYEIAKKQMANGKRKKILSSYVDCIIKIDLGLLDNKTYQEYKEQLEDGEYEYWSYKYNQYKKANFILTKPSITTEYAYDDEIGIDDMEITLEKSSDVS